MNALFETTAAGENSAAALSFARWKKIVAVGADERAEANGPEPNALRFAVQTRRALFVNLLAAHVGAAIRNRPSPLPTMIRAADEDLRRATEDLESGAMFRRLKLPEFAENEFFGWCAAAWSPAIAELVRDTTLQVNRIDAGALLKEPHAAGKALQNPPRQMFPDGAENDAVAPVAPLWLVELVLSECGFVGDPDGRFLDPACGSGELLVAAIRGIRQWRRENAGFCDLGEIELCRKILANIVGFDRDPLATMTARANYFFALGELLRGVDDAAIPVHLRDAMTRPAESAERFDYVAGVRHGTRSGYQFAEKYLKDGGKLCFPIDADVFKTPAEMGDLLHFRLDCVHDWSRLRPGPGPSIPAALFSATKGRRPTESFPYVVWKTAAPVDFSADPSLADVAGGVEFVRRRVRLPNGAANNSGFAAPPAAVKKLLGTCVYLPADDAGAGAPFQVVWRLAAGEPRAVVLARSPGGVRDESARIVCASREEALCLAGLLNSTPCRAAVYSLWAPGQPFAPAAKLKRLRIGRFDRQHGVHKVILHIAGIVAQLSARPVPPFAQIAEVENQLDKNVLKYWNLAGDDLAALKAFVDERECAEISAIGGE